LSWQALQAGRGGKLKEEKGQKLRVRAGCAAAEKKKKMAQRRF
jgi:hypothetical protein